MTINMSLIGAAKSNDNLDIANLIKQDGINSTYENDESKWTALHWAVLKGHVEFVKGLINHGANICIQDKSGWSALHVAAWSDEYECAELLLNAEKPLSAQGHQGIVDSEGETARNIAGQQGNQGPQDIISLEDSEGRTAGDIAGERGHQKIVSLIENFALSQGVIDNEEEIPALGL